MIGYGQHTKVYTDKLIEVCNEEEMNDALNANEHCTILITQSFTLKTKHTYKNKDGICLRGLKNITITYPSMCSIKFKDCTNISVENIRFSGDFYPRKTGEILLQFVSCTNCYVHQCEFLNGEDEQLCIKENSDNITISNTRFLHNSVTGHAFSVLIGKNENDKPECGTYHITFYQCLFDGGAGRKPRCRNARVDLLNCYWGYGILQYHIGAENSDVFFDSCIMHKHQHAKVFRNEFGEYKIRYENTNLWEGRNIHHIKSSDTNITLPNYTYSCLSIDELEKQINQLAGNK